MEKRDLVLRHQQGSNIHHFHSHSISDYLVIWAHLSERETGKCNPQSGSYEPSTIPLQWKKERIDFSGN